MTASISSFVSYCSASICPVPLSLPLRVRVIVIPAESIIDLSAERSRNNLPCMAAILGSSNARISSCRLSVMISRSGLHSMMNSVSHILKPTLLPSAKPLFLVRLMISASGRILFTVSIELSLELLSI